MGMEKEGSKGGGGYVGGFFELFDWTAKSRKKLFSSKSDLPEHSKQGKRSDGSLPMTRIRLTDDDEIGGAGSSIKGGSDYSCASSVTDEDGYGARAPGVVARLMGLDSMPTCSFAEPNSTPFFDGQSLRYTSYRDHQLNSEDDPPKNFVESKPQKVLSSRPIEKFQTEILPPKSAKSISISAVLLGMKPGVVARLMGLDSMPTCSFAEPNSTPFFDGQSLRYTSYRDHQLNSEDDPPKNFVESKPQKVLSSRPIEKFQTEILPPKSAKSIPITHHKLLSPIKSPGFIPSKTADIEKFQTEILPPKSAKSIPITHHKLLSPIKSPGFIPSKTAAHIMEAAAKIIEPTPQAVAKAKIPVVGSSSVPLRVRDLKEKLGVAQKMPLVGASASAMRTQGSKERVEPTHKISRHAETSRRPVESNAAKYLKGQSLNKSWNGSDDTPYRAFSDTDGGSSGLKTMGKSISLAIQAKVNVQRREGLNTSSNQGLVGQKEQSDVALSQPFRSQPNAQKSSQKRSPAHNASGVLRQNNQKQNCMMDKDKLPSRPLVSNLQGRKALSGNPPGRHKISGKSYGSRKLDTNLTESGKGNSNFTTRNNQRKKRSIDGKLHLEKNQVVRSILSDGNWKAIESNPVIDGRFGWAEESKRKGMDVVSFTFTAPLTRSVPGFEPPSPVVQKNSVSCMDNLRKRLMLDENGTSVGYNVIGGCALNTLLEQKLRELTKTAESSSSLSTFSSGSTAPRVHYNKDQRVSCIDKAGSSYDSDLFSMDPAALRLKNIFQGIDEMDSSSKSNDSRQLLNYKRPSPISVLDHSFSTGSSSSMDSMDSCSTEGSNKHFSSIQAREVLGLSSLKKFHFGDADTELLDSASSTSAGTMPRKHPNTGLGRSAKWEIEYMKKILGNLEMMFEDFTLGQASEIINPHLFHELERRKDMPGKNCDDARVERKVIFDCVIECLDLRCRGGGYRTWVKTTMVRKKEWLAEEVYKEMSAWRSMRDCMVDELVDKDMSSKYGRWLDFEVEAFAVGVEVEGQIMNSLVNEVVADILRF